MNGRTTSAAAASTRPSRHSSSVMVSRTKACSRARAARTMVATTAIETAASGARMASAPSPSVSSSAEPVVIPASATGLRT